MLLMVSQMTAIDSGDKLRCWLPGGHAYSCMAEALYNLYMALEVWHCFSMEDTLAEETASRKPLKPDTNLVRNHGQRF